jgi:thymidine phosphorylase
VLEFDPDLRGGDGFAVARSILDSGRALAKLDRIIGAQGRRDFDWRHPRLGALVYDVAADADGVVTGIDNERLARVARLAGAPKADGAGVDLLRKIGDTVAAGEPLYRVYATNPSELDFARRLASQGSGYVVGDHDSRPADVSLEF